MTIEEATALVEALTYEENLLLNALLLLIVDGDTDLDA